MEKELFYQVVEKAAAERGLTVVEIAFDDDDHVFEVTIDREGGDVDLADCEYVHRAVLAAPSPYAAAAVRTCGCGLCRSRSG